MYEVVFSKQAAKDAKKIARAGLKEKTVSLTAHPAPMPVKEKENEVHENRIAVHCEKGLA